MRTNRSCSSIAPHLSLIPVAHVVNAVSNSALDPHFYYLSECRGVLAGLCSSQIHEDELVNGRNEHAVI